MPQDDFNSVYQKLLGSNPSAPFSPNNPFAQPLRDGSLPESNVFSRLMPNHMALAGAMNDALLAASMTPTSRTTGENISNVARSIIGLPAARLQQQASMYQPAQQWEETQAGIRQKSAAALSDLMQGMYASQRPGLEREGFANQLQMEQERTKQMTAQHMYDSSEMFDDKGFGPYKSVIEGPEQGSTKYFGSAPRPAGYQPTFMNEHRQRLIGGLNPAALAGSGLDLIQANQARNSLNLPPISESAFNANRDKYMQQNAQAGALGAAQGRDPSEEHKRQVDEANKNLYADMQPIPEKYSTWMIQQNMKLMSDAQASGKQLAPNDLAQQTSATAYQKAKDADAAERQKRASSLAKYAASKHSWNGVDYNTFKNLPENEQGQEAPQGPAPQTPRFYNPDTQTLHNGPG